MEPVNSQLDYKKSKNLGCTYPQLVPILPTDSSNLSLTNAVAGTRDIIIPQSVVFNPAESILSCLVSYATGVNFVCAFADNALGLIRSLEVVDVTGNPLVQIFNASQYYNLVFRTEVAYKDFLSMGQAVDGAGSATAKGSYPGIQRRWSLATTTVTYSTYLRQGATAAPVTVYAIDIPSSPADILISATGAAIAIRFHVKLAMLCKNLLFSQNKFMYFGQNLTMKLAFNLSSAMAFIVDANTIAGAPAAYTGTVTVSDMKLWLCVSRNEQINNQIMAAVNANNFSVLTGWLRADFLNGTGSATSRQIQLQYSNVDGKRLVKTSIVPYNQTSGAAAAVVAAEQYKHSLFDDADAIGAAGAPSSYRSTLDTVPLQPGLVNCAAGFSEAWLNQSELLEGSLINSDAALSLFFSHTDNFSDQRVLHAQDLSVETGKPLQSQSSIYQWQATTVAGDCSLYAFSVFQRELLITPSGCRWI